nr:uncharacterized protein LOC118967277 [Manis javanica]
MFWRGPSYNERGNAPAWARAQGRRARAGLAEGAHRKQARAGRRDDDARRAGAARRPPRGADSRPFFPSGFPLPPFLPFWAWLPPLHPLFPLLPLPRPSPPGPPPWAPGELPLRKRPPPPEARRPWRSGPSRSRVAVGPGGGRRRGRLPRCAPRELNMDPCFREVAGISVSADLFLICDAIPALDSWRLNIYSGLVVHACPQQQTLESQSSSVFKLSLVSSPAHYQNPVQCGLVLPEQYFRARFWKKSRKEKLLKGPGENLKLRIQSQDGSVSRAVEISQNRTYF